MSLVTPPPQGIAFLMTTPAAEFRGQSRPIPGMALRQLAALPLGLLRSGWHSPALPSVSSALTVGRRSPERGESGRDRCLRSGSGQAAEKVSQGGFTSQVSSSKSQELLV